ncbi:Vacuolar fusion protein mon1b [Blyttiomyces sp. JEL0837]|nr:Vacuolar fusion protein mon1b [Blyttiomyces sp. JEL0837]
MFINEKDSFFELMEFKGRVVKSLETCLDELDDAMNADPYSMIEINIPGLRHFVCRSKTLMQYTEPGLFPPYTKKKDYKRLMTMYQYVMGKFDKSDSSQTRVVFCQGEAEAVLGWASPNFEIYASFSPLITKTGAMSIFTSLQKWIKNQETSLFLMPSVAPVF